MAAAKKSKKKSSKSKRANACARGGSEMRTIKGTSPRSVRRRSKAAFDLVTCRKARPVKVKKRAPKKRASVKNGRSSIRKAPRSFRDAALRLRDMSMTEGRVKYGLQLAGARELLHEGEALRVVRVRWEDDDYSEEGSELVAYIEVMDKDGDWDTVDSVGGIDSAFDDDYREGIEAQLALEAKSEIRRAIRRARRER